MRTGELAKARAIAYDCVYNGVEVGGGSLRIYRRDVQAKVFDAIGLSAQETQDKFGWLLEVFELGAPPHGGIAFGLDRLVMLLAGAKSIRCVRALAPCMSRLLTWPSLGTKGCDRISQDRHGHVPAYGRAGQGDSAAAGGGAHGHARACGGGVSVRACAAVVHSTLLCACALLFPCALPHRVFAVTPRLHRGSGRHATVDGCAACAGRGGRSAAQRIPPQGQPAQQEG